MAGSFVRGASELSDRESTSTRRSASDEELRGPLDASEIAQFVRDGFIRVRGAFSAQVAANCVAAIENLLPVDQNVDVDDPGIGQISGAYAKVAPREGPPFDQIDNPLVLAVFDQLAGAGAYDLPDVYRGIKGSLAGRVSGPWAPPVESGNWHIDFGIVRPPVFRVDSPHCAFVPIYLLSPTGPDSGPTVALPGSHFDVAQLLAAFGRRGAPIGLVRAYCDTYPRHRRHGIVQLTGAPGDLYIVHPLLIHSASGNVSAHHRFISNSGVATSDNHSAPSHRSRPTPVQQPILDVLDLGRPVAVRRWMLVVVLSFLRAVHVLRNKGKFVVGERLVDFDFERAPRVRRMGLLALNRVLTVLNGAARRLAAPGGNARSLLS